jgi:IS5 family transposase
MIKQNHQLTFGMQEDMLRRQKPTMLDDLLPIIPWSRFDAMLRPLYTDHGRPAIPPLALFKMLLLEQWYDLSDVQVVQEVHDRRSFERFIGLEIRDLHIDDSTLVRFRNRLREADMDKKLFELLTTILEEKKLFVRKGTIVDSTLVKGATKPNSSKRDGTPVDPDISAVQRRTGQIKDGMKVHLSIDVTSELIERVELTNIRVTDTEVFETLLPPSTGAAYADKAYFSAARRQGLQEKGIDDCIMKRGARGHLLSEQEIQRNARLSPVRAAIERRINDLKRWCHLARLRYVTRRRNLTHVYFAAMCVNIKRARKLTMA